MTQLHEKFPRLYKVCELIDDDNGLGHTQPRFRQAAQSQRIEDFHRWDDALSTLTKENWVTIAAGDQDEALRLMEGAAFDRLHDFLNNYFEM